VRRRLTLTSAEGGILDSGEPRLHIPNSLLFQWHVTDRCNLRCAHCYQETYAGDEPTFQDLLGILNQFTDLLDSWHCQSGRRVRGHVTVTGGEPFIRADFPDLLNVLSSHRERFSFAILTNGSLIDASVARLLHGLKPSFVQVSIEGSPATHDSLRGAGNFTRTVKALETLVRHGVRTFISFTAHRGNLREFHEVARLGRTLRVARVWADRLIPCGSGFTLADTLLTPDETRELFEIMYKARANAARKWFGRTEVAMHRALQFLVGGGAPYQCAAGDSLITVMPNGDVFPCRRMPIRVGNLFETQLSQLYYQSDLLRSLRDRTRVSQGCEECCYAGLCRGGLRCLSYSMSGDPFTADPGCWLAKRA
jgi:radical SAM protein with 4Fe4S-binding SPASM domain